MASASCCKVLCCWLHLAFVLLAYHQSSATDLRVVENSPPGTVVGTAIENGANSDYMLSTPSICATYFNINASSVITVKEGQTLDREQIWEDLGSDTVSCLVQPGNELVHIAILDENDEAPYFFDLSHPQIENISESLGMGAQLTRLTPLDGDKGLNGMVHFNITSGNEGDYVRIDAAFGDDPATVRTRYIFLKRSLNFENTSRFNLTITITDMGDIPLSSTQVIIYQILNVPDEPPMFSVSSYNFDIFENQPVGSQNDFGRVEATSDDPNGNRYQICIECYPVQASDVNSTIGINETTGYLYLKKTVLSSTFSVLTFIVKAFSSGLDGSALVKVEIGNINEEAPYFTCLRAIESTRCNGTINNSFLYIMENTSYSSSLLTLMVQDDDATSDFKEINVSSLELIFVPQTFHFSHSVISSSSSVFVALDLNGTLDREQTPNFTLTLVVENIVQPTLRSTSFIHIVVVDDNDNVPSFITAEYEGYISEGSPVGREVLTVRAQDPDDAENGFISYSIDQEMAANWFQISQTSGLISVNDAEAINYQSGEGGKVRLTVTASDNGSEPLASSATIVITILPSSTFLPNSYQEYSSADFDSTSNNLFFEFRTTEQNGLLIYQQDSQGGVFSVQLREGNVFVRSGTLELHNTEYDLSNDEWYTVYVHRDQTELMLEVTLAEDTSRLSILQDPINTERCVNSSSDGGGEVASVDHQSSLYVGGVNSFLLHPNSSITTPDFLGGIRNVLVGGIQLNSNCPITDLNTMKGVVRSRGCAQMSCNSNHTTQCIDYAEESYCQCRGFSSQVCKATEDEKMDSSYFPIRFKGNANVNLELDYSFFYELQVRENGSPPGDSDAAPSTGTGVGTGGGEGPDVPGERRRRRRRTSGRRRTIRDISGSVTEENIVQEIEVRFRLTELQNAVLLYSITSSSVHLVEIVDHEDGGTAHLLYRIYNKERSMLLFSLSTTSSPLMNHIQYAVTATIATDQVSLYFLDKHVTASWDHGTITPFAEYPQTSISIGGVFDPILGPNGDNLGYFSGCVTRVAIDKIELPLNGLLTAPTSDGGFQIEGGLESVGSECNLCDVANCMGNLMCISDLTDGSSQCQCSTGLVLEDNDSRCVTPIPLTTPSLGLTASVQSLPITYIGAGSGAALLVAMGIVVICLIAIVRKRAEKKKRTCPITPMSTRHFQSSVNQYTPTMIPKQQQKSSLTSSTNILSTPESNDRGSSVSTFQEHGGDVDSDSPVRHSRIRHKSCTSLESGINTDIDQEAIDIRTAGMGRGFPQMEDSGHEVNSTDSVPGSESDDIASSCYNHKPHPTLKIMGGISSPEHSHTPLTPLTPLTPKEKKVMIPLRPPSTSLSQSEYGDEATDIEIDTRSSEMGSSMQNQGRGSDSENSKISGCSTPQWYKSSTTSDTERENERIHTTRPYYPSPQHQAEHHHGDMTGGYHFKEEGYHHHHHHHQGHQQKPPPMYHSPPSFSEHINGSSKYSRGVGVGGGKARPVHPASSPLTKTLQMYENYPLHQFNTERPRDRARPYDHHSNYDSNSPRHDRQHSDPRMLCSDIEYTTVSFSRQYSDPKIPRNGNYCIPRKHADPIPAHQRQHKSDQRLPAQRTQDPMVAPKSSHSMRHVQSPNSYSNKRHNSIQDHQKQFYTLDRMMPDHIHGYSANNQPSRSYSSGDAAQNEEPFQTLKSLSKIDPITNWDAQDRMKIAVDHMDPYHLLSGPYVQFEDVSTDPSVIESQLTMDESVLGEQVFESQGGGEGSAAILDPLDVRLVRLRDDEIDSLLTDSELGGEVMNHFPSADCSSQYTATIIAGGSTSTSGESTPKLQKVFVIPSSQQSFDV